MLKESLLTEAASQWEAGVEGSELTKGTDACNVEFRGKKKYGFMMWSPDSETVGLVATESAESLAEAYSLDEEGVKDIFDLKEGETSNINGWGIVTRIW